MGDGTITNCKTDKRMETPILFPSAFLIDYLQKFLILNHGDAESQSFIYFSQCLRDSVVQKEVNLHSSSLLQKSE